MGERIAYWIRTPQVPGSRPGWYGTFYWASDCWPPWQHQVERSLVCVEGRGRISRSGLTQDIKMGSCVFQCDVPHRWIAQRQVGPVSVYCDGVGCRVLCLRHGISVWQHIGQSTTATSRHRRDMTSDKQTNKNCWVNQSRPFQEIILRITLRKKGYSCLRLYFSSNIKRKKIRNRPTRLDNSCVTSVFQYTRIHKLTKLS